MEFLDAVRTRQSIRTFAPTPVEPDKLEAILEAANRAPSAGNLQAYRIYVATRPSDRQALSRAAVRASGGFQEYIASAPLVLVFCADPAQSAQRYGQRGVQLYSVQDATIACSFAMLAATDLGLGSVWVGAFNPDAVREVIGAPEGIVPVAILPLGYAAARPERRTRRPRSEMVFQVGAQA